MELNSRYFNLPPFENLGPRQNMLIDALLYGGYTRVRDYPHRVNRKTGNCEYCVMGLAAETARVNGLRIKVERNDDLSKYLLHLQNDNRNFDYFDYNDDYFMKTQKWYGMNDDAVAKLMEMNDHLNMSFGKIAKRILKNPSKFFSEKK